MIPFIPSTIQQRKNEVFANEAVIVIYVFNKKWFICNSIIGSKFYIRRT